MHGRWLTAAAVLALVGCQTIREEMPTGPTSSSPAPAIPVIIVDVTPSPTPSPAVPPTPPEGPGLAPSPAPAPAPGARACTLPPGGGSGDYCPRQSPSFLAAVEKAMDELAAVEPQLFDLGKTRGCGSCYLVKNPTRYVNRVAEIVRTKGFCAIYDGEELAVKDDNKYNDQYDILTADNFVRRQLGSYRGTCYPAWF
jgi:hypothetical protein